MLVIVFLFTTVVKCDFSLQLSASKYISARCQEVEKVKSDFWMAADFSAVALQPCGTTLTALEEHPGAS